MRSASAAQLCRSLLVVHAGLACTWACTEPLGGGPGAAGTGASAGSSAGSPASDGSSGSSGSLGASGSSGASGASGGQAGSPSGGGSGGNVPDGGAGASGLDAGDAGDDARPPRPVVTPVPGATLVKLNPALRQQTFEGWGTSLCWWANNVGGWAAGARNALVDLVVDPVNGLGYNVFRYNIGGGENPAHSHMGQFRDMPGFELPDGTFDWNADANQRAVLERLVARGSGLILEAFSNSPPYWMTNSGCASGNGDGSNNLRTDSYDVFASYLAQVVKHYRDAFGISFRTLEPMNEPNASWWTANGSQEGCHFSPAQQQTLIQAVGAALTNNGLTGVRVSAADENSIDDAVNNGRGFSATTLGNLSQINVHSYAGTRRAELRALATAAGKRLWQSESGPLSVTLADDTAAALFMAGRIITDLKEMQPEAWLDWQVADPSRNWASFAVNNTQQTFGLLKRFYMHAGFSRYIRPGATFIQVDNADMVAAVSADASTLTLVVRNGDTAASRSFTFDLTALPDVGAAVEIHRTSRTENLAALSAIAIQGFSFTASVSPYSVTTFVIPMRP